MAAFADGPKAPVTDAREARKLTDKCIRQHVYWSTQWSRSILTGNVFLIRPSQATPISLHRLLIRVGFRYLHPLGVCITYQFPMTIGYVFFVGVCRLDRRWA